MASRLGRAAVLAVALWAALLAPGCELFQPTTTSPTTGRPVTLEQLRAEEIAAERKAEAEARDEALRAQAELARVQREAEHQILREQAASDARLAEIRFEAEGAMEGVRVELESRAGARAAALEGLRASYAAARADLEAKAGLLADVAGFAEGVIGSPAVQAAGAANPLIAAGLGLAGLVFGRWSKAKSAEAQAKDRLEKQATLGEAQKQRELAELRAQLLAEMRAIADKTWDEAKAESRSETLVNNATWDEATREAERRALLAAVPAAAA